MCGICGFIHLDPDRTANPDVLVSMTNTLRHRGPDGEGFHCEGNVALGHRRLAIIDPTMGIQPMYNDDLTISIVLNGEIYNYIELREELKALGHTFRTSSDTEVVIRAYEQWGTGCQERFNGMWAFAIHDTRRQQLFVSRDRLGEKPLFWTQFQNSFIFGSEIKSLLAYGIPVVPETHLLKLYLTLGYIPAPYTYYAGIRKLQPGHFMLISHRIETGRYWELPDITENDLLTDKKQVYNRFSELLYDSVKLRMRSDVPFGAMLSGGLDSSTIVGMMSGISTLPVETFTIGYKEKAWDERKLAKEVATAFHCHYNEFMVSPERIDEMYRRVLDHFDEPFGDSSAVAAGLISGLAAQKVKMVLTGDGGDEVLSGYTMYQGEKFAGMYGTWPSWLHSTALGAAMTANRLTSGTLRLKADRATGVLRASGLDFMSRLILKASWSDPAVIDELLPSGSKYLGIREFFEELYRPNRFAQPMYRLMWYNFKLSLPDDMLTKVDRMSMAASIEARVPFLDHRLVEFMYGVDMRIKMEGFERKSVLRRTMDHRMPASLLRASKKGFALPLQEWYRKSSLYDQVSRLGSASWIGNQRVMQQIIDDNASSRKDYGNLLFLLSIYNFWLEKNHS